MPLCHYATTPVCLLELSKRFCSALVDFAGKGEAQLGFRASLCSVEVARPGCKGYLLFLIARRPSRGSLGQNESKSFTYVSLHLPLLQFGSEFLLLEQLEASKQQHHAHGTQSTAENTRVVSSAGFSPTVGWG
jgi:hypothetical protein